MVMCRRFRQWPAILWFAKATGTKMPVWLYLIRFYVEKVSTRLWADQYCENPEELKDYLEIEGLDSLKKSIKEGKGVILAGVHCGPPIAFFFFHEILNIDIKVLVEEGAQKGWENYRRFAAESLISKKIRTLTAPGSSTTASDDLKGFVRHLAGGGVLSIYPDVLGRGKSFGEVSFLSLTACFSLFAFRLALKHDAPLYFSLFTKRKGGGYRLRIVPCESFDTPEEGLRIYAAHFETELEKSPYRWLTLPSFLENYNKNQS
ncbi:MAG: hypothetical protein V3T30_05350 [Thermodesulfobacteriota bacterium]